MEMPRATNPMLPGMVYGARNSDGDSDVSSVDMQYVGEFEDPCIGEDGLSDDEFDVGAQLVKANWVVKNSFLELRQKSEELCGFRACRSDSRVGKNTLISMDTATSIKTGAGFCVTNKDEPMYIRSTDSSTRESSADDLAVTKEKSVRLAEDQDEIEGSFGNVVNVSSIKTAYTPMHQACADSSGIDMFRMSNMKSFGMSRLPSKQDGMCAISSLKTNYSPVNQPSRSAQFDFMSDSASQSPRSRTYTEYFASQQNAMNSAQCETQVLNHVLKSNTCDFSLVPMIVALPLGPTPVMQSLPAMAPPPGVFLQPSKLTRPPGIFSKPTCCFTAPPGDFTAPPGDFTAPPGDFSVAKSPDDDLLEENRRLKLQQAQLLEETRALEENKRLKLQQAQLLKEARAYSASAAAWRSVSSRLSDGADQAEPVPKTTLVLRDLPPSFSRDMVADLLNEQGFEKRFNFIYAPAKFGAMSTIGYAFVNFTTHAAANSCFEKLQGFNDWHTPCESACKVVWSETDQGLDAIIERHRNSPVMHTSVPDDVKPTIYEAGVCVRFPPPTKKVRPPRTQRYQYEDVLEQSQC